MTSGSSPALYISATARQSGYGTDQYKKVTFLTPDERTRVQAGERVFFKAERLSAKGPAGTYWRVAKPCGAAIGPRVPKVEEVAQLRRATGIV